VLVDELCRLYGYRPVLEYSCMERCPHGDGIWDILGFYKGSSRRVYICEAEIEKHTKEIKEKIAEKFSNLNEEVCIVLSRSAIRELVRLHEHSHAILHIGDFNGLVAPNDEWFSSLKPEINEPLTEFISYSIIRHMKNTFLKAVFEWVDEKAPDYYKRWLEIKIALDRENVMPEDYWKYIPGVVEIAREEKWTDLDALISNIENRWQDVITRHIDYISRFIADKLKENI